MNYSKLKAPGYLDLRKWWGTMTVFGKRFTRLDEKDSKRHRVVVRGGLFALLWVWSDDHVTNRPGMFTLVCPSTKNLRIISDTEFAIRIAGVWSHFITLPEETKP